MSQPRRVAPSAKLKPRIDANPAAFDGLLASHGHRLLWESACRCACLNNGETGQPATDCPVCEGTGWDHYDPVEVRGIVDSLARQEEGWLVFGDFASGTALVTVPHAQMPGRWHRYTFLDSVMEHSETRVRTAPVGGRERLRYPIAKATASLIEAGPDGTDLRVNRTLDVFRLRRAAEQTPGRFLPAGEPLRRGVDFAVVDGLIDWTLGEQRGTAPAPGERFAVAYLHHPRMVVGEFVHGVRDTFVQKKSTSAAYAPLPVTVRCKLDFLGEGA